MRPISPFVLLFLIVAGPPALAVAKLAGADTHFLACLFGGFLGVLVGFCWGGLYARAALTKGNP